MRIFPAIDLYDKKAVRLVKGDFEKMTIYSDAPLSVAKKMEQLGAKYIHIVDLEGAKLGTTPNIDVIKSIVDGTDLFVEVGGGIRSMEVLEQYIASGVSRVILGTVAVTDEAFVKSAIEKYGDSVAIGADIKDGFVAIKGWIEQSQYNVDDFFKKISVLGAKTVICTDVSKDGNMCGTNRELYKKLSEKYDLNIIASGGVSSIDDIIALNELNLYGAIIGKAYYIGAIDLSEAIEVAK